MCRYIRSFHLTNDIKYTDSTLFAKQSSIHFLCVQASKSIMILLNLQRRLLIYIHYNLKFSIHLCKTALSNPNGHYPIVWIQLLSSTTNIFIVYKEYSLMLIETLFIKCYYLTNRHRLIIIMIQMAPAFVPFSLFNVPRWNARLLSVFSQQPGPGQQYAQPGWPGGAAYQPWPNQPNAAAASVQSNDPSTELFST